MSPFVHMQRLRFEDVLKIFVDKLMMSRVQAAKRFHLTHNLFSPCGLPKRQSRCFVFVKKNVTVRVCFVIDVNVHIRLLSVNVVNLDR